MNIKSRKAKEEFRGVTLILPAYDEEGNIFRVAQKVIEHLDTQQPLNYEVIIVDDGSKDRTNAEIERLRALHPDRVTLVSNARNRGYGFAIRQGIIKSRYDLIFFTDADGQFNIEDIDLLLPLMKSGVPDIVVGYRKDRQDPWIRLFLSGCYNVLVRILFRVSVKDVDCAFKLFRKGIFDTIDIKSKNFFINTEILAKAVYYNFRILEIGVDHLPRTAGKSTVNFRHIPLTLIELTRIWLQMRELKSQRASLKPNNQLTG